MFFFFFEIGNFFSNWEKSHLNPIGKGAEFPPLRTPKNPVDVVLMLETGCVKYRCQHIVSFWLILLCKRFIK